MAAAQTCRGAGGAGQRPTGKINISKIQNTHHKTRWVFADNKKK